MLQKSDYSLRTQATDIKRSTTPTIYYFKQLFLERVLIVYSLVIAVITSFDYSTVIHLRFTILDYR